MTHRYDLRRSAIALACALVAALAGAAPATAGEDGRLPVLLADSGPTTANAGDCGGHAAFWGEPVDLVRTRVNHQLYVWCSRSSISIAGYSELHNDLDLDTANGFDRVHCGPATFECRARKGTDAPVLIGLPMRHHVHFTLTRTDGSRWTGTSSICQGAGTSVATCWTDQVFVSGASGRNDFG